MAKAVVFGGSGMLGRRVASVLTQKGWTVSAPAHAECSISNPVLPLAYLLEFKPDVVINCAGMIPHKLTAPWAMYLTNTVGPHILAHACTRQNIKLIHISTDCVFAGTDPVKNHYSNELPDPVDDYGRSKLAGEPSAAVVVRTSFVGPEHGLWKWFADCMKDGIEVEGWTQAYWSGSTVLEVAERLVSCLSLSAGVYHLTTHQAISKYNVLTTLARALNLSGVITPVDTPIVNRRLQPDIMLTAFEESLPRMLSYG